MAKKTIVIQPTECIGNSLNTINTNFNNLQSSLDDVVSKTNEIIDYINDSVLFVPVNYTKNNDPDNPVIKSNQTVEIANEDFKNLDLNAQPYYSKSYKTDIPNRPSRCVAVLIHVYLNTNARKNNSLNFWVKERNAAPNNDFTPNSNAVARYQKKFKMDATGGPDASFEAESDVIFPVYLDNTNENGCQPGTFQWRISDNRRVLTGDRPVPRYGVIINLLGFYIDVNLKKIA